MAESASAARPSARAAPPHFKERRASGAAVRRDARRSAILRQAQFAAKTRRSSEVQAASRARPVERTPPRCRARQHNRAKQCRGGGEGSRGATRSAGPRARRHWALRRGVHGAKRCAEPFSRTSTAQSAARSLTVGKTTATARRPRSQVPTCVYASQPCRAAICGPWPFRTRRRERFWLGPHLQSGSTRQADQR